jgi:hypothetical protein
MAGEQDMTWLQRQLAKPLEPGCRKVFGIVTEAEVVDPGCSARFRIQCPNGPVITEEFVFTLNPCNAVGGLVALELTQDDSIESYRFKATDDMCDAHFSQVKAQDRLREREKQRTEAREERYETWKREQVRQGKKLSRFEEEFGPFLSANKGRPHQLGFSCKLGEVQIQFKAELSAMETTLGAQGLRVYEEISARGPSSLSLVTNKVKIVIIPESDRKRPFSLTVPATDVSEIFGDRWPHDETWTLVVWRVCQRKGLKPSEPT